MYLLVLALSVLYVLPQCIAAGYEKGAPIYALIALIPMMLFAGGLEEAGWRYILQPELEKKYPYIAATIIVSLIWWLWHLPLFYINGVGQEMYRQCMVMRAAALYRQCVRCGLQDQ